MKKRHLIISILGCIGLLVGVTNGLFAENQDSLVTSEKATTIFENLTEKGIKEVTIRTHLDSLTIYKRTNKQFPAVFNFANSDGQVFSKSVTLKPRGKSRRDYCSFPPLKIKFDGDELTKIGWRNQHKSLKLVTHCNEGWTANQNVFREYLAYQIYGLLTENSLKTQLFRVNYEDFERDEKMVRYAVLLEDIDELAERTDGKEVEGYNYKLKDFDKENHQIFSVFQYMIGNTDWTVEMNRNVKFIRPKRGGKMKMIPYDFDSSGFVAPDYAKPNVNLDLQTLQQRLFLGKFSNKTERTAIIARFNEKKSLIYDLVNNFELLDTIEKIEVLEYINSFYTTINNEALLNRAMPIRNKQPEPSDMEGEYHLR